LLNELGRARGKALKLCVRVPETVAKCREAGIDLAAWDADGLVDMINVSPFYFQTMGLEIERFREVAPKARIYGELNYVTDQKTLGKKENGVPVSARRYTTPEAYRGAAFNLLSRGADGISLFNFDYVPGKQRLPMTETLKRITDTEWLKGVSKNYIVTHNTAGMPANHAVSLDVVIPDDTGRTRFREAVLRVETAEPCAGLPLEAGLNGTRLEPCEWADTELFPPLERNASCPARDRLAFYAVPLTLLVPGANEVSVKNTDKGERPCRFMSLEIALIR
jgi:hypothetical protein